jgi:type I restriction enzyme S subunit
MSEWKEVKLQDVTSILGDGLHGTPEYTDNGEYYFINGNNLNEGNIVINNDTKRVSYTEYLKYKKQLNDRTLLVSINGTLGNVAYYKGEKVVLGKSACYFNLINDIDKRFVKYTISSNYFTKYINLYATGTTIQNVSLKTMREFSFKLPELKEQEQIADVLSCLDAKIENLRRQNETLEQIAQTLFKHWFIDFEFPNADGKPYKSSGGGMFASDLGDIPEGWNFGGLGEFTDISIGRTPPRKDIEWFSTNPKDIKWVSIRDMGNCGIYIVNTSEYLTQEAIDKFNIPVIPEDTVILSFKLTVGRVAITTEQMLSNEAIAHIKLIDNYLNTEYLYLYLKQYNFSFLGSTSSIATAVNSKSIKSISVLIPSKPVITAFRKNIFSVFQKIKLSTKQIETLTKTRDSLLPKLMSGQLRIGE